jgi:hypothetical protein
MKRATIVDVRPTTPKDGEFFTLCTCEQEAREMAEDYIAGRRWRGTKEIASCPSA